MSHGIFGYLVAILIFYVSLGLIFTSIGSCIELENEPWIGTEEPVIRESASSSSYWTWFWDAVYYSITGFHRLSDDSSSEFAGGNFMLNLGNILCCTIPGIPQWIQIGLFGTLDMVILIIIAFWARGING